MSDLDDLKLQLHALGGFQHDDHPLVSAVLDAIERLERERDEAREEAEKFRAALATASGQLATIEEDGTAEHDAAVDLRSDLAKAREEARRLREVLKHARGLCWCQPTSEGFVVCTICAALAETERE